MDMLNVVERSYNMQAFVRKGNTLSNYIATENRYPVGAMNIENSKSNSFVDWVAKVIDQSHFHARGCAPQGK
jgi:hypothetical protein